MEKVKYRALAQQLMFDMSDEEIAVLDKEFETLLVQMDILDCIDTEGVEPMVYPFETPTTFMREDIVKDMLSQQEVLSNAPQTRSGHIVVPKVVK